MLKDTRLTLWPRFRPIIGSTFPSCYGKCHILDHMLIFVQCYGVGLHQLRRDNVFDIIPSPFVT